MRIRVLGPFGAIDDDGEELSVGGPKQSTVLGLLCIEPGRRVSTDLLTMAVWGDEVPDRALRSLSTYVSNLRRELGDIIASGSGSYALTLDRSRVDSCAFADAVAAAGRSNDDDRLALYRDALSLWTGTPFEGMDGFGAFREESNRLGALRLEAERAVIETEIETGDAASVVPRIDALVHEFPFDEALRGLHMRALYRSDRQAEALASYNTFRNRLADELGLEPTSALRDLELRVLQHDKSLDPKDHEAPVIGRTTGLPNRYSSFVGRQTEVTETRDRLTKHRLVSLVGAGGIGKSSVALEAARVLDTHEVTVVHVPIESIGKGDVDTSVARSIGLEPAASVDPVDVIAGYVATRPHLLILDGCEAHITEVARLADRLLSVTESTVLATSREPLGLSGESTIRIDALPLAAAEEIFKDRAELPKVLDDEVLEAIRTVCVALDGMPLAIELAAARAKTVPLDRLAVRMSDQIPLLTRSRMFDERHGSLLAALDWSYDLLDNSEQSVLLALSMFLTPFSMEDAEAMLDDPATEDHVSRLVEMSFLQPPSRDGGHRFLEPVRQYAHHKLAESGLSENLRRQHGEWAISTTRRMGETQYSPTIRENRAWIFSKRDELLAAFDWAQKADEPDLIVGVLAALGWTLTSAGIHGPFVAAAMAAIGNPAATRGHDYVIACANVSGMLALEGRTSEALEMQNQALAVAESSNDLIAQGEVKQKQALLRTRNGDLDLMDEAFELLHAGGEPSADRHLYNYAWILLNHGRFQEATEAVEGHRRWWKPIGTESFGYSGIMSTVRAFEGDWEAALDLAERSASLAEAASMYRNARAQWEDAGHAAIRLQSTDRLANAVAQSERIAELTGAEPSILLGIESALVREDFDEILQLAGHWFAATADDVEATDRLISSDHEIAIHGSISERPAIFAILRPVAAALLASGRRDEACRIVNTVPDLMKQSKFEYWSEFRELELWESLFDACGGRGEPDPDPLTLPGAFNYVKELLATEGTNT